MKNKIPRELVPGFELGGYKLERCIGRGGYGAIFAAKNIETGKLVGMKIEKAPFKRAGVATEAEFIRGIGRSPYFPEYIELGNDKDFRFLTMELMGPSLSLLKYDLPKSRYSKFTGFTLAKEMLKALEALHSRGILHRDVKPGNYILRASQENPVCLIDFGLARRYTDTDGSLLDPREKPGFVGTIKYASVNAHEGREQCRGDDLISWFFTLIDMIKGGLPWPNNKSKSKRITKLKRKIKSKDLCKGLPSECGEIYDYIMTITFFDKPDYERIYALLDQAKTKVRQRDYMDWEKVKTRYMKNISAIDMKRGGEFFESKKRIENPNFHICNVQ